MENDCETRFMDYIQKIAAGPRQSKDLTQDQAQDALNLILNGEVSPIRTAIFLIAARMKRESLEENLGYWKALDACTVKQSVRVKKLLQVADPFDGFSRTPCFSFYAIPVIAKLGLSCYGHSAEGLPPKFGTTFQRILRSHYQIPLNDPVNIRFLEEEGFCFVGLHQSHPKLESLRDLRREMVKRSVLSTFEKMLMPLKAARGENILATTYFHRGYEEPMIKVARLSDFNAVLVGNGLESTTLFGVHKPTEVFIVSGKTDLTQRRITISEALSRKESDRIRSIVSGLNELGISVEERPDGYSVTGGEIFPGEVNSRSDHRIAMAFAIAGLVVSGSICIKDTLNVRTSFPGFVELAASIGLQISEKCGSLRG